MPAWLIDRTGGKFDLLCYGERPPAAVHADFPVRTTLVTPKGSNPNTNDAFQDIQGHFARRYDATPGTIYLLRPDQHVAGRWRNPDAGAIRAALERAVAGPVRSEAAA